MVKPGTQTTEFYKSLATMIIGGMIGLGVIDPLHLETATSEVGEILQTLVQIVGLIGAVAANASYNNARALAKQGDKTNG